MREKVARWELWLQQVMADGDTSAQTVALVSRRAATECWILLRMAVGRLVCVSARIADSTRTWMRFEPFLSPRPGGTLTTVRSAIDQQSTVTGRRTKSR